MTDSLAGKGEPEMKAEPSKLIPRKRIRASRPKFDAKLVKTEEPSAKPAVTERGNEPHESVQSRPGADAKTDINIKTEPAIKAEPDCTDIESLHANGPAPKNWKVFLERVREMRSLREAPVDTMGCERVGENGGPLPPKTVRFQHLVALMLSAQTKDEITAGAVTRLREKLQPTLTPESVVATPEQELEQLILPVGFFRRKAMFLRKASQILLDKYDGDIPRTIDEITQLPGVGPKMGYLLLQSAWNVVDGIGVDVHVHRLAQLWHWVPATKSPTPEKTRVELEKWMPKQLWKEINPLLVGFGQTWCPPRSSVKTCKVCHLFDLCPSAKRR